MSVYNAWVDRVPLIVVGGNDLDAAKRPPGRADRPCGRRTSTRWCATSPSGTTSRLSAQHFAQSFCARLQVCDDARPMARS